LILKKKYNCLTVRNKKLKIDLGYCSISTLFRVIEKRVLNNYLLTAGKKKYLELNLKGKKSIA
tara:strand:- start:2186 stop:2374 length:189 start_codon:yes stop_codon:yes gene_type:complete